MRQHELVCSLLKLFHFLLALCSRAPCSLVLAHFKASHSVTFVKELPKTASGKIQKYILRGRSTDISLRSRFTQHSNLNSVFPTEQLAKLDAIATNKA